MPTRADIVACARSWIGTRWQHQQRLKGEACDCAGLVMGVGYEVFGIVADIPAYGHTPHRHTMEAHCDRYLTRIKAPQMQAGDVLLIAWEGDAHHMAIVSDLDGELGVIHAYAQVKKVVEHRLDDQWRRRIRAVYAFPGVD